MCIEIDSFQGDDVLHESWEGNIREENVGRKSTLSYIEKVCPEKITELLQHR
jgi:hypothetical protein